MLTEAIQDLIKPGSALDEPPVYRSALRELRRDLAAAESDVEDLSAKRDDTTLYGSEDDAAALEADLRAERRRVERIRLAIPKLEQLLERAVAAEAREALDVRIDEAAALHAKASELVERYATIAGEIAAVVGELRGVATQMERIQIEADRAGRGDDLPSLNVAALLSDGLPSEGSFGGSGSNGGIRLPEVDGQGMIVGRNYWRRPTSVQATSTQTRSEGPSVTRIAEPKAIPGVDPRALADTAPSIKIIGRDAAGNPIN